MQDVYTAPLRVSSCKLPAIHYLTEVWLTRSDDCYLTEEVHSTEHLHYRRIMRDMFSVPSQRLPTSCIVTLTTLAAAAAAAAAAI
jgi:hypothetical protein